MQNQYQAVLNVVRQSQSIANKYVNNSHQLISDFEKQANDQSLQIMLYGAYNAGKSTLVNALLQQSEAKVADIPTTDSVDCYNWQGMRLLDTPGVNAPIAHEEVTTEQLKRTAAILFVIRDGDMDSKDVFERLIKLANQGKSLFIVLNHQLQNVEDRSLAASKIRQNLVKMGAEQKLADSVNIYPINLKTALKGRLENKEKLVEHSGFQDFLTAFNVWLNLQNEEKSKFDGFKIIVDERWFQPAIHQATSKLSNEASKKITNLQNDIALLISERDQLISKANGFIRGEADHSRSQLLASLGDEAATQKILDSMSEKLNDYLGDKFKDVGDKLKKIPSTTLSQAMTLATSNDNNEKTKAAVNLLSNKENVKQALELGKKLNLPIVKDMGKKLLGTWAGRIATVAQVAMTLWEILDADKKEAAYNAEQRRIMVERQQVADGLANEFVSNAYNFIEEQGKVQFDNVIQELQKQINEIQTGERQLQADISSLTEAQNQMKAIYW